MISSRWSQVSAFMASGRLSVIQVTASAVVHSMVADMTSSSLYGGRARMGGTGGSQWQTASASSATAPWPRGSTMSGLMSSSASSSPSSRAMR